MPHTIEEVHEVAVHYTREEHTRVQHKEYISLRGLGVTWSKRSHEGAACIETLKDSHRFLGICNAIFEHVGLIFPLQEQQHLRHVRGMRGGAWGLGGSHVNWGL